MKINSWVLATLGMVSMASAMGPSAPTRPKGKPVKLDNFKWADPFAARKMKKFSPSCETEQTFTAREYLLDDLSEPPPLGLEPWSIALKKIFKGRPYPGSWDGIDPHGYDRNLLMMEYSQVPIKVREWIEDNERKDGEGKGLYAIYDKPVDDQVKIRNVAKLPAESLAAAFRPLDQKKVVVFAPGALYDILPLWVAESSSCKETLLDTAKYSAKLTEGAVVAWPTYTRANRKKDERDMKFTIKAHVLTKKADEGEDKDEL